MRNPTLQGKKKDALVPLFLFCVHVFGVEGCKCFSFTSSTFSQEACIKTTALAPFLRSSMKLSLSLQPPVSLT